MIAYVDSSVLLRIALREPRPLPAWRRLTRAFTSELTRVECFRTIDRLRLAGKLDDAEVATRRELIELRLEAMDLVALDRRILRRAAEPMPTSLRTLDAIHVASALALRPREPGLRFATHDEELAIAARAVGLPPA
ncbi:MAG: type II toxin-antitoxin system VapC family toxin [Sandaracinaceae bacterium]